MYTDGATVRSYSDQFPERADGEIEIRAETEDQFLPPGEGLCFPAHAYDRRIQAYSPISVEHAVGLAREEYARHLEQRRADEERLAAANASLPA